MLRARDGQGGWCLATRPICGSRAVYGVDRSAPSSDSSPISPTGKQDPGRVAGLGLTGTCPWSAGRRRGPSHTTAGLPGTMARSVSQPCCVASQPCYTLSRPGKRERKGVRWTMRFGLGRTSTRHIGPSGGGSRGGGDRGIGVRSGTVSAKPMRHSTLAPTTADFWLPGRAAMDFASSMPSLASFA
jgi:hypothetical protein